MVTTPGPEHFAQQIEYVFEALVKMCTLPLLAGDNISAAFVVPTVASSVDIVVHLGTEADGRRRVREIVGVTGRVEGEVIETSDLFTQRLGRLQRGEGYPPHEERFANADLDLTALLGHPADRHAADRHPGDQHAPSALVGHARRSG